MCSVCGGRIHINIFQPLVCKTVTRPATEHQSGRSRPFSENAHNYWPAWYILKRKSFATLTKMLVTVPFFGPKQSLSDNPIEKSLYLPCIQHKNQKDVAYGCRTATIILRQLPILKLHGYNTSHVMRKIFF